MVFVPFAFIRLPKMFLITCRPMGWWLGIHSSRPGGMVRHVVNARVYDCFDEILMRMTCKSK